MESYKSECSSCGATYFWTGYKTGLGKTEAQLVQMRRDETVCRQCGVGGLKTTLDRESPAGRDLDDALGSLMKSFFGDKGGGP